MSPDSATATPARWPTVSTPPLERRKVLHCSPSQRGPWSKPDLWSFSFKNHEAQRVIVGTSVGMITGTIAGASVGILLERL